MDDFIVHAREFHEESPFAYWAALAFISCVLTLVGWGLIALFLTPYGVIGISAVFICWGINNFIKKYTGQEK